MSDPIDIRNRELYPIDKFAVSDAFVADLSGILIPSGEIKSRIDRLREEIRQFYKIDKKDLLAIPVLKGAVQFFVELLYDSRFEIPFRIETISSSRYGDLGDTSEKKPIIQVSNPEAIEGKDVLLVEDIVDNGLTLRDINQEIKKYRPRTLSCIVLLDKIERREYDVKHLFNEIWTGFIVPNEFVVGHGIDYKEMYRSLQHIAVLKRECF